MSPGLILGAVWVLVIQGITGKCSQPWCILIALAIFIIVNGITGFVEKKMLHVPISKRTVKVPHAKTHPRVKPRIRPW